LSGNGYNADFAIDGYSPSTGEEMWAAIILAGPRFFETLRLPSCEAANSIALTNRPEHGGCGQPATVVILGETMREIL